MAYNIFTQLGDPAIAPNCEEFGNLILRYEINLQFESYLNGLIDLMEDYGSSYTNSKNPLEYYLINFLIDNNRFRNKCDLIEYLIKIGFTVDINFVLEEINKSKNNKISMEQLKNEYFIRKYVNKNLT